MAVLASGVDISDMWVCFYLLSDVLVDARPVYACICMPCTGTLMCPSSKNFFLSPGGTIIASQHKISPSSTMSESHCPWYGHNAFRTSLMSSGHPAMIMSARALSSESSLIVSW